ncbi:AAA family ATPase [Aerococcus viridans]|uniref:Recombination protein RecF n=1 Tax=Aerococcus viridans TaxID=1377 RepID=A0A2J9PLF5_9LACT|nr:AAA family ATPase [Aerococcus viridans]MCT1798356.1 AAA family ATPase [Aerococcus viridans]PNL91183.1 recombination protein RecF [Aerococcus viridans]
MLNEIVEWIKNQPYWQQYLGNLIFANGDLDDARLETVYLLFKQEFDLVEQPLQKEDLPFLIKNDISESAEYYTWDGVSNITGVNALSSKESLSIGSQITLIYGENGTGKSGYTRLLNNAFLSRGDKNIISNIYSDANEEIGANFHFTDLAGKQSVINFPKEKNKSLFNSVAVFDTVSAMNDLTKENEISFAPIEFRFFEDLMAGFVYVKNSLETAIKKLQVENPFIIYFKENTSIRDLVLSLNKDTDLNNLEQRITLSEKLEVDYKEKMKRKAILLGLNVNKKVAEYNHYKTNLKQLEEKIKRLNEKFSSNRLQKTKDLLVSKEELEQICDKEGLKQFKDDNIYLLGSSEWKNFIQVADTYYKAIDREIDHCIFCGQSLEHVHLIDKYWKFLSSAAEKNLSMANKNINKITGEFLSLDTKLIVNDSKLEEWLKEEYPGHLQIIFDAELKFEEMKKNIVENLGSNNLDFRIENKAISTDSFNEIYKQLDKKITELNQEEVAFELKEIKKFEEEYDDIKKLKGLLPQINSYILNLRWIDKAQRVNPSTNRITTFQNQLFKKYVTQEYVDNFKVECKNLQTNFSAQIVQRGRKGTTLSKLTVQGKRPIEILSEGEQRSIALANFLAETKLNPNNNCLVFDDPVSSLDHKRREAISRRLVEEAKCKQIVIFTHDITFLLSIQQYCDKENISYQTTTLRKLQNEAGFVQNNVPWIGMTVKNRISYLRNELQSVEKTYKLLQSGDVNKQDEYEKSAKLWCEQLRETWERMIEEILFNNSVQRFSPAIQTQRLKSALFTKDLYQEVENGMSNCSNWVHDRAAGLGEAIPTPEELIAYLEACDSFQKSNKPK